MFSAQIHYVFACLKSIHVRHATVHEYYFYLHVLLNELLLYMLDSHFTTREYFWFDCKLYEYHLLQRTQVEYIVIYNKDLGIFILFDFELLLYIKLINLVKAKWYCFWYSYLILDYFWMLWNLFFNCTDLIEILSLFLQTLAIFILSNIYQTFFNTAIS